MNYKSITLTPKTNARGVRGKNDPAEANREKLERGLDKLFKKYIRLRDRKCVISGITKRLVLVYYYPPSYAPALRWDERNAHTMGLAAQALCSGGDPELYPDWMREHYSVEDLRNLRDMATRSNRVYFSIDKLLTLCVEYTKKIAQLQEYTHERT
jgi:hypothetical protein